MKPTCKALIAAKWHTPEHTCSHYAVKDGFCLLHLEHVDKLRVDLERLRIREQQLVAMTDVKLGEIRGRIASIEKHLATKAITTTEHSRHAMRAANGTY